MKRSFVFLVTVLCLVGAAQGQTIFWQNDGVINCPPDLPPQVDAINVINNNFIAISMTNFYSNSQVWDTSDTLNFTNNGAMIGDSGFRFDNAPSYSGFRQRAANIVNRGSITVGTGTNLISTFIGGLAFFGNLPKFIGNATNVVNSGSINLGFEALCDVTGESIDMNRGTVVMDEQGFDFYTSSFFFNGGIFDGYWGLSTNIFNPRAAFES